MITRIFPISMLLVVPAVKPENYTYPIGGGMAEFTARTKKELREEKRAEKKIKKALQEA